MFKRVCRGYDKVIEEIKDTEYVMLREGVWNDFEKATTSTAIKRIQKGAYSPKLETNTKNPNIFYVTIPGNMDMF